MAIWDILWPFGTFCIHSVHFSCFGIMYQEKSGNPGRDGPLHTYMQSERQSCQSSDGALHVLDESHRGHQIGKQDFRLHF
jgi:hypothetical protein